MNENAAIATTAPITEAAAIAATPAAAPKTVATKAVVLSTRYTVPGKIKEGIVCPVCGGKKSHGAGYCLRCYRNIGSTKEARKVMETALGVCEDAFEGMVKADLGNVDRRTIFTAWAMFKMPKVGKAKDADSVGEYYAADLTVKGGAVQIFIFGENKQALIGGRMYSGVISLRERLTAKGWVRYIRIQVPCDQSVTADAKLAIMSLGDDESRLVEGLPRDTCEEQFLNRRAVIGFTAVK